MSIATIERRMTVFVDPRARTALLLLPRDAVPSRCDVGKAYCAVIDVGDGPGRTEHRAFFQIAPEHNSYGRSVPPLAWALIMDVDRDDQLFGKTYRVRNLRDATPAEGEEVRAALVGRPPPARGYH